MDHAGPHRLSLICDAITGGACEQSEIFEQFDIVCNIVLYNIQLYRMKQRVSF